MRRKYGGFLRQRSIQRRRATSQKPLCAVQEHMAQAPGLPDNKESLKISIELYVYYTFICFSLHIITYYVILCHYTNGGYRLL